MPVLSFIKKLLVLTLLLIIIHNEVVACNSGSIFDEVSKIKKIDRRLLYSIAAVESVKRNTDGKYRPWPWSVGSSLDGEMRFENKEQATIYIINHVNKRKNKLVDIGFMQVNYLYHGYRVIKPEDLLDPVTNIFVAADILNEELKYAKNDIFIALGRYHAGRSAEPKSISSYWQTYLEAKKTSNKQEEKNIRAANYAYKVLNIFKALQTQKLCK